MRAHDEASDEGYMLLAVLVLVFMVLLTLSVAAPRVAMQIKHDQELETQHRAQQYVRAIRLYYKKFGHYPGSIEQLEKTNNQRFLRQRYLDPLTGKDDWRLIQVGQNKTKVKGFFGQDLPGIGGGLGSAAGMQSPGQGGSNQGPGAGNGPGVGNGAGNGAGNGPTFGSPGGAGNGGVGGVGAPGSAPASGGIGSGIGDQNATDYKGGGGPIMGVGVPKTGPGFLTVNEKDQYEDWEFLYDPRIEQLYAKGATLSGGGLTGSGSGLNGTPGATPAPGVTPGVTPPVANPQQN